MKERLIELSQIHDGAILNHVFRQRNGWLTSKLATCLWFDEKSWQLPTFYLSYNSNCNNLISSHNLEVGAPLLNCL